MSKTLADYPIVDAKYVEAFCRRISIDVEGILPVRVLADIIVSYIGAEGGQYAIGCASTARFFIPIILTILTWSCASVMVIW
jgi:hypothetical protein